MALYSLIQFTSVTLMLSLGSSMSDFQFLYVDLILTIPIATVMCHSKAYFKLGSKKPTSTLMSKRVLISLGGQILFQAFLQVYTFLWVQQQSWYTPPNKDGGFKVAKCFENTAVFLVSSYQYLVIAVVYSVGPPFRERLSKNGSFTFSTIKSNYLSFFFPSVSFMIVVPLLFLLTLLLHFSPPKLLFESFSLVELPFDAKFYLLLFVTMHLVASLAFESVIQPVLAKYVSHIRRNKSRKGLEFESIEDLEVIDINEEIKYEYLKSKIPKWIRTGKRYKILNMEMNP